MKPVKLIVTSKINLKSKYGKNFSQLEQLLKKLQQSDAQKDLDTKIVYIDDAVSAKKAHITAAKSITEQSAKKAVDDLYKYHVPAYIVILGAQDVIPFQEIDNPAEDEDANVPSDLPYACDAPFSRKINNFTGPTRVVGRIPDIPGTQADTSYFERLIGNIIKSKPVDPEKYRDYFSVSAWVWKRSTELSLLSMFGHNGKMIASPKGTGSNNPPYRSFSKKQLSPMTHFYNCHGADLDQNFYGQKGSSFPEALESSNIPSNITAGTIVAAECCYGAQLQDTERLGLTNRSIANNYLENNAIAFVGSSTIAYGPSDSQSLADLITQYFVKNVLKGASTGRAFLEARQRFLTESGPDLDPCELKTLAQFYLLGDPSVQPAQCEEAETTKLTVGNATMNSRKNLFIKGKSLENSIGSTRKQNTRAGIRDKKQLNEILKKTNFNVKDKGAVYQVKPKNVGGSMQKKLGGMDVKFHTFQQDFNVGTRNFKYRVLVVKENSSQILGWRAYESR
jgi:hypothetical protein